MSQREDAMRFAWQSEGGAHIQQLLNEMIAEPREELAHVMATSPDRLTGKLALKYAIRAKALVDFKEEIESQIRVSQPSTQNGQGT